MQRPEPSRGVGAGGLLDQLAPQSRAPLQRARRRLQRRDTRIGHAARNPHDAGCGRRRRASPGRRSRRRGRRSSGGRPTSVGANPLSPVASRKTSELAGVRRPRPLQGHEIDPAEGPVQQEHPARDNARGTACAGSTPRRWASRGPGSRPAGRRRGSTAASATTRPAAAPASRGGPPGSRGRTASARTRAATTHRSLSESKANSSPSGLKSMP